MHFSSSSPCLKNMTTGFSSPLTSLYSTRTIMPLGSIDSPVKNCRSLNFPRSAFITAISFINNILHCRSTRGERQGELLLLSLESIMNSNHSITFGNGFVNVCLSKGNLVFIFFLVFSKLGTFQIWLNCQPDLEPLPCLGEQHSPNSSLAAIKCKFLILQLLELHARCLASCTSLKP